MIRLPIFTARFTLSQSHRNKITLSITITITITTTIVINMSHYNRNPNHHTYHSVPSVFAVVPNSNPRHVSIVNHNLPFDTHNLYDVTFHNHTITTLLTSDPSVVNSWISETLTLHRHHRNITVGLDVEWRPSYSPYRNPVAVVQLCIANRCLVFQILHTPSIPYSLAAFLGNARHTFVGVGIGEDVAKLLEDYSLSVANFVDLRNVAADRLGESALRSAGIKTLSSRVLGLDFEKPKRITMSMWDNAWLSDEQVQYACVDAFVSYEVGRSLMGF